MVAFWDPLLALTFIALGVVLVVRARRALAEIRPLLAPLSSDARALCEGPALVAGTLRAVGNTVYGLDREACVASRTLVEHRVGTGRSSRWVVVEDLLQFAPAQLETTDGVLTVDLRDAVLLAPSVNAGSMSYGRATTVTTIPDGARVIVAATARRDEAASSGQGYRDVSNRLALVSTDERRLLVTTGSATSLRWSARWPAFAAFAAAAILFASALTLVVVSAVGASWLP